MAIPPRLNKELAELNGEFAIEIVEDSDYINLIFKDFVLGDGFNMPFSDLLLKIPKSYPDAGPDMFWTHPELTLEGGAIPQCAEHIENNVGRNWRRFSWHPQSPWNPTVDNLHSFIEFIRSRLANKA